VSDVAARQSGRDAAASCVPFTSGLVGSLDNFDEVFSRFYSIIPKNISGITKFLTVIIPKSNQYLAFGYLC